VTKRRGRAIDSRYWVDVAWRRTCNAALRR
jgi:hypothetical protein